MLTSYFKLLLPEFYVKLELNTENKSLIIDYDTI